ncbi:hypothetical protein GVN24_30415 [Rhizobium sp. CRIBSB]|nr:hypothetical protein [Rhizobium sp. CRIBSB]
MAGPVHYEVFIRKTPPSPWTLLMATEERQVAIDSAEETLRELRAAAVRVTKETLDPRTMEFSSTTLLTKGAPEVQRKQKAVEEHTGPRCNQPGDLYAPQARELISRVLDDWLVRQNITAFELLHRPDLAEKLDASGVELQHAIQKVAVPESQASGRPVHDLMRHYQKLADQAVERVIGAGRRKMFPTLAERSLGEIANTLMGTPDRAFIMGGVISGALTGLRGGRARLDRLMDLADQAPTGGAPQAQVMVVIEQIACELLAVRANLADVLGPALDQGASLAAVVRMIAPREVEALIAHDPKIDLQVPALEGPAARLAERLQRGELPLLVSVLSRMVLRELMSPRRLRPRDPAGEIDILRILATTLTATGGRLLTLEEIQAGFTERSKNIVTADFVTAYVAECETVMGEAERLTRLCVNVTGPGNKRSAGRWLAACVTSLRFEMEQRQATIPTAQRLAVLAGLQREVRGAGLPEPELEQVTVAIGKVGGAIEADARIVAQIGRATASPQQKLNVLLRLAAGESAPLGPVSERARAEVMRLMRAPETRAALAAAPETLAPIKGLMQAAGLAA